LTCRAGKRPLTGSGQPQHRLSDWKIAYDLERRRVRLEPAPEGEIIQPTQRQAAEQLSAMNGAM
jgi:hypothetical protein